jgi:predicted deacylase
MTPKKTSLIVFLFIFSLLIANPALCQETLKVGGVTSASGEIKSGFISVPAGTDGPEIRIPITVVNGKKKGLVLALTAGIHGYEYPPILALQRLRRELDPAKIRGTVIMVHVVNMPSRTGSFRERLTVL